MHWFCVLSSAAATENTSVVRSVAQEFHRYDSEGAHSIVKLARYHVSGGRTARRQPGGGRGRGGIGRVLPAAEPPPPHPHPRLQVVALCNLSPVTVEAARHLIPSLSPFRDHEVEEVLAVLRKASARAAAGGTATAVAAMALMASGGGGGGATGAGGYSE
jgi:hypothetical protein